MIENNLSTAPDAALPALPGVNLEAGLRVARHNLAMYRRLLIKFRDTWSGYRQLFEDALEDGAETCQLAHNLKGVAANLGIEEVERLAGELERTCREATPHSAPAATAIRQLYGELDRVLAGLRALG